MISWSFTVDAAKKAREQVMHEFSPDMRPEDVAKLRCVLQSLIDAEMMAREMLVWEVVQWNMETHEYVNSGSADEDCPF